MSIKNLSKKAMYQLVKNVVETGEATDSPIRMDMRKPHADRQDIANRRNKVTAFIGLAVDKKRDYPVSAIYYPAGKGEMHYYKDGGMAKTTRGRK